MLLWAAAWCTVLFLKKPWEGRFSESWCHPFAKQCQEAEDCLIPVVTQLVPYLLQICLLKPERLLLKPLPLCELLFARRVLEVGWGCALLQRGRMPALEFFRLRICNDPPTICVSLPGLCLFQCSRGDAPPAGGERKASGLQQPGCCHGGIEASV